MQDVYAVLKPVFDSETFRSALRQAGLVRQANLAAGMRKEPDSAAFGLRAVRVTQDFNSAICSAFLEHNVPDAIVDALGYHSFMFFGINPRVFEMAVLALNGVDSYSLEALKDIMEVNKHVDTSAIIRGEDNPMDTLIWMRHLGNNFANYLVECRQA